MEETKKLILKQGFDLWYSFKHEILYKNRFIQNHPILDYVKIIAEKNKKSIEKNTILYRARIFDGDEPDLDEWGNFRADTISAKADIERKKESGFWGYDEDGSFIPQDNSVVTEGRANPSLIKYLYTSESPYTALTEVRPYLGGNISVAEIKVTEEIKIADFSYINDFYSFDSLEDMLMRIIMRNLSNPINTNKHEYIPTQYIAEYLKNLKYDGIKFNSSLHKGGYNITIFNYSKCKAVSSKLYKIKDICIDSECIAPLNKPALKHSKLKPINKLLLNLQRDYTATI